MAQPGRVYWSHAPAVDRAIIEAAAIGSLKNSDWTLVSGSSSTEFYDVDDYVLGRRGKLDDETIPESVFTENPAKNLSEFLRVLSQSIHKCAEETRISRLVFVDKGNTGGPLGMIALMSSIVERTNLPAAIVRLGRRSMAASFKGRPVAQDERLLLVSDVATSGSSLKEAADILWRRGARVPAAHVVYDRDQGAAENLARIDIELWTLAEHRALRIKGITTIDRFDDLPRDFAGFSMTG